MRHLILRPLLGSALLAAQTLLAGAAGAQDLDPRIDPDLVACVGVSTGVSGFLSATEEQVGTNTYSEIQAAFDASELVATALMARLAEQSACGVPYAQVGAAAAEAFDREYWVIAGLAGSPEALRSAWVAYRPRLACYAVLSETELERARDIRNRTQDFPCGWNY